MYPNANITAIKCQKHKNLLKRDCKVKPLKL